MVEMIEDLGEEDYQYEDEFEEVSFYIISIHFGSICATMFRPELNLFSNEPYYIHTQVTMYGTN